jgi:hypothetical protein
VSVREVVVYTMMLLALMLLAVLVANTSSVHQVPAPSPTPSWTDVQLVTK